VNPVVGNLPTPGEMWIKYEQAKYIDECDAHGVCVTNYRWQSWVGEWWATRRSYMTHETWRRWARGARIANGAVEQKRSSQSSLLVLAGAFLLQRWFGGAMGAAGPALEFTQQPRTAAPSAAPPYSVLGRNNPANSDAAVATAN